MGQSNFVKKFTYEKKQKKGYKQFILRLSSATNKYIDLSRVINTKS